MELNKCLGCMEPYQGNPCPHCGFDSRRPTGMEYALPLNTILAGKYLVGRALGQGGFGITYIGWDIALERKVAIKEYYPSGQVSRNPGNRNLTWYTTEQANEARKSGMEMFLKEARKMVKVDRIPGIVRVLEIFQENGTAYIVMEFVEGETLKARLAKTGPLPWNQAEKIFKPVIHTMAQVHKAGLIHRDISPDNLMMTPDGGVQVLDLGAAKDLSINSGASSMQVAKSGFSPLEQYIQRGNSGPWTDVYAIGATIYYTLTGKLVPNAVDRLNHDTISWAEPGLAALSPTALTALQQSIAVQSSNRIQSMDELELRLFSPSAAQSIPVQNQQLEVAPMRKTHRKFLLGAMVLTGIIYILTLILSLGTTNNNTENVRGVVTPRATEESATEATSPMLSLGSSRGNHYSNSFLGIQCTLDDSWAFLSDEEIRERNNLSKELLGEKYQKMLESADSLQDMMATQVDGVNTINITLTKLSGAELFASEEDCARAAKDVLADGLGDMGITVVSVDAAEMTFAGAKHYCIQVSGTCMGYEVYETVVCMKRGNYMAAITACTWITNETAELLNYFEAI